MNDMANEKKCIVRVAGLYGHGPATARYIVAVGGVDSETAYEAASYRCCDRYAPYIRTTIGHVRAWPEGPSIIDAYIKKERPVLLRGPNKA